MENRFKDENYVKGLEERIAIAEAAERYEKLGMSRAMAKQTASFEIDGNKDGVASNLRKFMDARDKQIEMEFMQDRPQPQSGTDFDECDPFLMGFNSVNRGW